MKATAFVGSTCLEAQVGPVWVTVCLPRFWRHVPLRRLFRAGWRP